MRYGRRPDGAGTNPIRNTLMGSSVVAAVCARMATDDPDMSISSVMLLLADGYGRGQLDLPDLEPRKDRTRRISVRMPLEVSDRLRERIARDGDLSLSLSSVLATLAEGYAIGMVDLPKVRMDWGTPTEESTTVESPAP